MTHQLWLLYLLRGNWRLRSRTWLRVSREHFDSLLSDRRGMAAGMAIMGFGGGAMIGTPMKEYFIRCSTVP